MKKNTLVSILFSVLVFVSQVAIAVPEASQFIGKENTMTPYLGGIIKLQIRAIASGGNLPTTAFDATTLELQEPMAEGDGLSYETASGGELGTGEELNAGTMNKLKFFFAGCQTSTGATEANLKAASLANERVQIKSTFPSGSKVFGGSTGVLFKFGYTIEPKSGAKKFYIEAKKFAAQESDVVS